MMFVSDSFGDGIDISRDIVKLAEVFYSYNIFGNAAGATNKVREGASAVTKYSLGKGT